jgi:hypothetical protein
MTPERIAALVAWWVRLYTRNLPAAVAERRTAEIDADLYDQIAHDRAQGIGERRIALSILSRMLRGLASDAAWRDRHAWERTAQQLTPAQVKKKRRRAYRSGVGLAVGSVLFLVWLIGAVGVIGVDGDRSDRLYLGVLLIGIAGALIGRFRARGMARALVAMAAATALVAIIALMAGKHEDPVTSIFELLGLNAMFITLFLAAAWRFHGAARTPPPAAGHD